MKEHAENWFLDRPKSGSELGANGSALVARKAIPILRQRFGAGDAQILHTSNRHDSQSLHRDVFSCLLGDFFGEIHVHIQIDHIFFGNPWKSPIL